MRSNTDDAAPPVRTRLREWVVPAYVLACIGIGGSPQGVGFALALQLAGLALLAWALSVRRPEPPVRGERGLALLVLLAVGLVVLQLVPLPSALWSALPWREPIAAGDRLLGLGATWRPWTLSSDRTIATAMAMIPPLAVLAAMIRARAYRADLLALAVLAATMLSVLLGIKQRGDSAGAWNLYPNANFGVATGTFANANFFGALLLAAIPLGVALGVAWATRGTKTDWKRAIPAIPILLLVALGMLLNGSLAVALLSVPVILLSLTLAFGAGTIRIGRLVGIVLVVALVGAGALVMLGAAPGDASNAASFAERRTILDGSIALLARVFPVGTGIGTFPTVYAMAQDPDSIGRFIVNHAHNDYAELAIETGIAGLLLVAGFIGWFVWQAARVWRSAVADVYARAGTIVAGTLLAHSAVDYPLRTSAMAAIFAAAVALVVIGNSQLSRSAPAVRHLRLD